LSLSQWNQNVSGFMTAAIDITSPIVGASSLALISTASTQIGYLTPTGASGLTKGVEQGRLRTLTKAAASVANGYGFGLVCMGSADTIGTVNGAFYRFELFSSGSYGLVRGNNNTLNAGTPGTSLASAATAVVQNVTYGIQIEWIADDVNFGGVYISLKKGTAIDFSDLVLLVQLVDASSSKLLISNSEGPYLRGYTSVTGAKVLYDNTELFLLA